MTTKERYKTNENYFKDINETSAYILGYLMADGCMLLNDCGNLVLSMSLSTQDEDIMKRIINELSPRELRYYKITQKSGKISNFCRFKITNRILCKDLYDLGIVPNKTGKEKFPKINERYIPDFLRGLFDGDGSISKKKCRNSDKYHHVFTITSGSKEMVDAIQKYYNFGSVERGHGNCWTFVVGSGLNIYKIYKSFYHKSDLFFLDRKKTIFKDVKIPQKIKAFGEEKSLKEWSEDERCVVSIYTIESRLRFTNMTMEEIITTKKYGNGKNNSNNLYQYGKCKNPKRERSKTIAEMEIQCE